MSSIYLPDELKSRLIRAARRRGYNVERGRQSQLTEYIAFLVQLDEQVGHSLPRRRTLPQALGLLARPNRPPPSDSEIESLQDQRRVDL